MKSVSAIKDKIADKGYAFVNVQPTPEVDKDRGIIKLIFMLTQEERF